MEKTKKSIEESTMASWSSYISTLEHALVQMEKSIEESISVPSACTNEWCQSVEEVIDELTEAIYALKPPRWASQGQTESVRRLKRKAQQVYAKYLQQAGRIMPG